MMMHGLADVKCITIIQYIYVHIYRREYLNLNYVHDIHVLELEW
jgi:hypothetical protein